MRKRVNTTEFPALLHFATITNRLPHPFPPKCHTVVPTCHMLCLATRSLARATACRWDITAGDSRASPGSAGLSRPRCHHCGPADRRLDPSLDLLKPHPPTLLTWAVQQPQGSRQSTWGQLGEGSIPHPNTGTALGKTCSAAIAVTPLFATSQAKFWLGQRTPSQEHPALQVPAHGRGGQGLRQCCPGAIQLCLQLAQPPAVQCSQSLASQKREILLLCCCFQQTAMAA